MAVKDKPTPNLTPELYLRHRAAVGATLTALEDAKSIYDTAKSAHQGAFKAAQSAGIAIKAMKEVMRIRVMDPDDAAMHYRNVSRFAAWEKLQIGTQGSLFGITDDQHPTDEAAAEHAAFRAEDDGHHEGATGAQRAGNPFAPGSETFDKWDRGWLAGQQTIADDMGPKKVRGRRKAKNNPEDRAAA